MTVILQRPPPQLARKTLLASPPPLATELNKPQSQLLQELAKMLSAGFSQQTQPAAQQVRVARTFPHTHVRTLPALPHHDVQLRPTLIVIHNMIEQTSTGAKHERAQQDANCKSVGRCVFKPLMMKLGT